MRRSSRVGQLQDRFDELKVEAIILSCAANVRYLTGFSGEGWIVLDQRLTLVTDGRFTLRAEQEAPGIEVLCRDKSMHEAVADRIKQGGATRVGFEADHLTVSARNELKRRLRGVKLVPLTGVLRAARMVKDASEIKLVRDAVAATDRAFAKIAKTLSPRMTEVELALEIERELRRAGADGPAFDAIVASGPNSADPHAEPTGRRLGVRGNLKLDFGGIVRGYHADLTRTLFLGKPTRKQREIYQIVLEAQQRAIAACRAGITGQELDAVARNFIKEAGYGEAFSHGLGHGVGLEIHEAPSLGHTSRDVLAPGMIVTIEPGIYLKGWGGIRIEDVVLITGRGHQIMTKAPKLDLA